MSSSASTTVTPSTNGTEQSSETEDALRAATRQIAQSGHADTAFGTPRVIGERTLIPVARVMYGFGGRSAVDSAHQQPGGSGGGVAVAPFALIEVTPTGVRVLPIVDVQGMVGRIFALGAAAMLLAAFIRRPHAGAPSSHIKIGRIEPRLSVTSSPHVRFHGSKGPSVVRRMLRRGKPA